MVDEDVRRLERLASSGDPAACVRLARSLEREGRRGEAARVLHSVIEHASARDELARYPAWHHFEGAAGRTRAIDAEPIEHTPRVLWRKRIDVHGPLPGFSRLLASHLGLVCRMGHGVAVMDARNGTPLWRKERRVHEPRRPVTTYSDPPGGFWLPSLALDGGTLLIWSETTVTRHEIATGTSQRAIRVPNGFSAKLEDGDLYLNTPEGLVARRVRVGDSGGERWRVEGANGAAVEAVAGELLFLWDHGKVHAVACASGAIRWSSATMTRDFRADASGVASLEYGPAGRNPALVLRKPSGETLWRRKGPWSPLALTNEVVVACPIRGVAFDASRSLLKAELSRLDSLSRTQGKASRLPLSGSDSFPVAVARNVIYGMSQRKHSRRLAACQQSGQLLWEIELEDLIGERQPPDKPVWCWSLAALDRLLYVHMTGGHVVALSDL